MCAVQRVRGHRKLLQDSPRLQKTCVGQVVLDKWFPLSLLDVVEAHDEIVQDAGLEGVVVMFVAFRAMMVLFSIMMYVVLV